VTRTDWSVVLSAGWPTWAVLALVGLGVAISAWTVAGIRREPVRRAAALGSLRVLSVAALGALVLRPVVKVERARDEPGAVIFLSDVSASMGAAVSAGDPATRADRAARLLRRAAPSAGGHPVRTFPFAGDVVFDPEQPDGDLPALPRGSDTRIAESVLAAAARVRGPLAGVVVVTDGAERGSLAAGRVPAAMRRKLAALRAPVHVVLVADTDPVPDAGIAAVRAPPVAFARTDVEIEVDIVAHGLGVDAVPVSLTEAGGLVTEAVARLDAAGRATVRLRTRSDRPGRRVLRASIPSLDGDRNPENDSREIFLEVIREKVRVLQIAGKPSWDVRFLRRVLRRDASLDLVSFFILRSATDVPLTDTGDLSLIPFPADELFTTHLPRFDVVLFQDFDPGPYGVAPHLGRLAAWVREGGALLVVGGDVGLSRWSGPLAEVLPVAPLAAGGPEGDASEFRGRLSSEGLRHPVTRLADDVDENAAAWNALSPIEGTSLVRGLRAGAQALAVHPSLRIADGPAPLIAAAEIGKGRSVAVLTDSTWLWSFEQAGEGGSAASYEKLWHNALSWLIRDPRFERLRVDVDESRVVRGQTVGARVQVLDRDHRPAASHPIEIVIVPAVGGDPVLRREGVTDDAGGFRVETTIDSPGVYRIVARSSLADLPGGRGAPREAEDLLLVEGAGDELGDPSPRAAAVGALARVTGGRVVDATRLDRIPDLPFSDAAGRRVLHTRDVEIWRHPISLVVVLGLLFAEWAWRRKLGHR